MAEAKMRVVLVGGKPYQRKKDGSLVPLKGKTDWKRLDRQTSAEAIAVKDREGPTRNGPRLKLFIRRKCP